MSQAGKLERLMNLMAALLETRRPLTRSEIRERVPGYPAAESAFRRAFERDKDDLRQMGVPVVVAEVPAVDPPIEGYRIPKDEYYLRDPGLDPDELAALHLAAQVVRFDGVEGAGALWKLGGVPATTGDVVSTGSPAEVASLPGDSNLGALFGAVGTRRPVTLTYRGAKRRVDPYRLDFARGRWYLTGYDHLRNEERNFRVDRIEGRVAPGAPGGFERPTTHVPGVRLAPWHLGEGEPTVARVLVDPDQAAAARAAVGPEAVVVDGEDGSIVIELAVTNPPGFRSFVLGFLDHAEVLDPPSLRSEIVDWLEGIAAQ